MNILVINGPNLNMLGTRETSIYGSLTLNDIQKYTETELTQSKVSLTWWQSNSEAEIIKKIHEAVNSDLDALIINPAAYSHTSVAILDALKILSIPIVEVHLTNVYNREAFRHEMLTAKASSIIMSGLGKDAYLFAVNALLKR